jgi:hypothetical protein
MPGGTQAVRLDLPFAVFSSRSAEVMEEPPSSSHRARATLWSVLSVSKLFLSVIFTIWGGWPRFNSRPSVQRELSLPIILNKFRAMESPPRLLQGG